MTYLLAKFTLLFLLATLLGFVLGYWWSRRSFVDVSESYEDLRKATEKTDATNWERLWGRFDALPEPAETDLAPVFASLDTVSSAVAGIPKPAPVDFAPVESRLESLASQIANIPQPEKPKDPDLRPLADRIQKLEQEIRAIPAPRETDLAPVFASLDTVSSAVAAIPKPAPVDFAPVESRLESLASQIANIPQPEKSKDPDLRPVTDRIQKLETAVSNIPTPPRPEPVNLVPVVRQIDALEKRVGAMPQPEKVDLKPIDSRLRSIESEIGKLGSRLARPAPAKRQATPKTSRPKERTNEPRILSGAVYGKKDDLKRISGVGPMLEKLLNKNGVYYFWQVASWSRNDIEIMDQRLDVFKGRILRDNWVSQAKQLQQLPEAARAPTK